MIIINRIEKDILLALNDNTFITPEIFSKTSGFLLSEISLALKYLRENGYIDDYFVLSEKTRKLLQSNTSKNAIILAAGCGMRMVPINTTVSKGFLEVMGERLIERTIRHLHEANVFNIYIVVGFHKGQYKYLIDKYNVRLIENDDFNVKNNLHSIKLALNYLKDSYIIPCDIWCRENPYKQFEMYSWYMVSDELNSLSLVTVNNNMNLCVGKPGNSMIGICYLKENEADLVCGNIKELIENPENDDEFWEKALFQSEDLLLSARLVSSSKVCEINTYEQLRELDENSANLSTNAMNIICETFHTSPNNIINITVLKKGMTNRSFLFECDNKKYIMRLPGEGTDKLIDRKKETNVYETIKSKNICDSIIYLNPDNGYKITEFINNARVCNPNDESDVRKCMQYIRAFHDMQLIVDHDFNVFEQIDFYEQLWNGKKSIYEDYSETKKKVLSLKAYVEKFSTSKVLAHIDAVPDNFLFSGTEQDEKIYLIDWEYAGMQDPHIDIAMFCIYSLYNKEQVDCTIDFYFNEGCKFNIRIKIYCLIAVCGLLWSNWCEYKKHLGVEFGEYSHKQYLFAKDFYKYAKEKLETIEETG